MNLHSIDCTHLATTPAVETEGSPQFQRKPANVEVRLGGLLEKIESKYERRLEAFLGEHEEALKQGYETHSGSRKQATEFAWTCTEAILKRAYSRLFEAGSFDVPLPTLSVNRGGSVDVTWRKGPLHLLVNIPPEAGEEVEYSYSWEQESPQFGKVPVTDAHEICSRVLADL